MPKHGKKHIDASKNIKKTAIHTHNVIKKVAKMMVSKVIMFYLCLVIFIALPFIKASAIFL